MALRGSFHLDFTATSDTVMPANCLPLPLRFFLSNETHDRRGTLTDSMQASRKAPHVTDSQSSYGILNSRRCSSERSKIIQRVTNGFNSS